LPCCFFSFSLYATSCLFIILFQLELSKGILCPRPRVCDPVLILVVAIVIAPSRVRSLVSCSRFTRLLSLPAPAKSVFEFGIFHPGHKNCIDSIDYKRSTLIVAPSYQSQQRRPFFFDRNSFIKHENQSRFHRIIFCGS
jgi:hypothetical protein